MPSRRDCGNSAARSAPVCACVRWPTCRPTTSPCSTPTRRSSPRSPATLCRRATASACERFHHGPGAFKLDYALDGPVPWQNEECRRAGTVHVVGSLAELVAAEADVAAGRMPDRPLVLVVQPTVFDPGRAPAGKHTLWAYAHVPHGYDGDATEAIERQIERFAPGFRDLVLARHVTGPRGAPRLQPELRRRRHRRRSPQRPAARVPADDRPACLPHAEPVAVPLLGVDPARRRRTRHVRPPRRRPRPRVPTMTGCARHIPSSRRRPG